MSKLSAFEAKELLRAMDCALVAMRSVPPAVANQIDIPEAIGTLQVWRDTFLSIALADVECAP